MSAQTTQTIKVKYDSAGLGPDANYLLYRQGSSGPASTVFPPVTQLDFLVGDEMHLYDISGARTIKSAHLRNLNRWSYNVVGFCMVDSSGKFWRWSFHDKLPPALVFRLVDRAPRERLRCVPRTKML